MYVNCDNMDLVYLFTNQILSDIHINIQQGTVYLLILWNKKKRKFQIIRFSSTDLIYVNLLERELHLGEIQHETSKSKSNYH